MKGIKNAAVVTLMMGVLYAVYITLSKPDPPLPAGFEPADVAALGPPQIDFTGGAAGPPQLELPQPNAQPAPAEGTSAPAASSPFSKFNKAPQFADASRQPRGGSFGADAGANNAPPVEPQFETPNPGSNPNNSEVPVVPEIPNVNEAAPEPTPAYPPRRGGSVYGGGSSTADASPAPALDAPQVAAPEATPQPARNSALTLYSLKQDWQQAQQAAEAGRFVEALKTLSKYYNHPDLEQPDQHQVNKWLDALAGKVIYSTEHHLAEPHKVGAQESLFDVAERYNVPWQLLQNINGVRDPEILVPGTTIKVVPGPFRAEVDLTRGELTLFLGDMYAGRFPFAVGNEPPQPGDYQIGDKRRDRVYIGEGQRVVNGTDPDNPYGGWWLDLGREASIHGSPKNATTGVTLGCISLSPQDAKDVYGILSLGSSVTIKR